MKHRIDALTYNSVVAEVDLKKYKEELIRMSINPKKFIDGNGLKHIHYAAYVGNTDVVRYLIEHYKENPNVIGKRFSPLLRALQGTRYTDNYNTIKYLIENGADVTYAYISKWTNDVITVNKFYDKQEPYMVQQSGDIKKLIYEKR